jgi:hypothetical protein
MQGTVLLITLIKYAQQDAEPKIKIKFKKFIALEVCLCLKFHFNLGIFVIVLVFCCITNKLLKVNLFNNVPWLSVLKIVRN